MVQRDLLRVALVSGIYFEHDAISYSLGLKLKTLRAAFSQSVRVEPHVFVQATDKPDHHIHVVANAGQLLSSRVFRSCDLRVYEFGIHYGLFDTILTRAAQTRMIGVDHNVTPSRLVEDGPLRKTLERSERVRLNLGSADRIICDSEFNRSDLVELGIDRSITAVLPLPPRVHPAASIDLQARPAGEQVTLLFVGRLVKLKGILDLLVAFARLRPIHGRGVRLVLAGASAFAESQIEEEVERLARSMGSIIRRRDVADDELQLLYSTADILVVPSYHEGYCLPVVEALSHGCQIVASDAGNLPNIVGRCGQLIAVGDVIALTAALDRAINSAKKGSDVPTTGGLIPRDLWLARIEEQVSQISVDHYAVDFLSHVSEVTGVNVVRSGGPLA